MKIEQTRWMTESGWSPALPGQMGTSAQLTLVFGSRELMKDPARIVAIREAYPNAHLIGCSTAGEISDTCVSDDSLAVTAVRFDHASVMGGVVRIRDVADSRQAGERIAQSLPSEGLRHVLVFCDGLKINGSELVRGIAARLPAGVTFTGGVAGDGPRFQETYVLCERFAERDAVAAVGLYGAGLRIGYGSMGGWDAFGPERLVTRSRGNVLYEFDGRSALALYKQYLGEHAQGLPATGLFFPLSLRMREGDRGVVRTILSVDEAEQSITFAGDVPEQSYVRLMKANFDRLIEGAVGAARTNRDVLGSVPAELALLISCVGRKMVLRQRVEEELEGVREVLGTGVAMAGFYSYGEIAPHAPHAPCDLHNQTMTITTLAEVPL